MPKIVIDVDDLYETEEAARLIGIGYATLYRWIKKGKLLPVRVAGRTLIPKYEIDRLKNKQATGVEPVA
ncbi:hypothetical protein ES706_05240 [subsurface metagenome]